MKATVQIRIRTDKNNFFSIKIYTSPVFLELIKLKNFEMPLSYITLSCSHFLSYLIVRTAKRAEEAIQHDSQNALAPIFK